MGRLSRILALAILGLAAGCGGPEGDDTATFAVPDAAQARRQAQAALARAHETIRSNQRLIDALQEERRRSPPPAPEPGADPEERLRELERDFARRIAELEARSGPDAPDVRPPTDFEGEVVGLDPVTGILTLSVGSADGVRAGYCFTIARDARFVAMVEVFQVEACRARARVRPSLQKQAPQVGDRVIWR